MNKFLGILAIAVCLFSASQARSQGPMSCNVNTSDPPYVDGQTRPCSQDVNGHIRTTAGGGMSPNPYGASTTEGKITVAVTNTYQAALASSATRKGCTIQYVAVAGTRGFVFFGTAPADTTTSFQLSNGQSLNCAIGGIGVATDAVNVTATAADIFIVSNQ